MRQNNSLKWRVDVLIPIGCRGSLTSSIYCDFKDGEFPMVFSSFSLFCFFFFFFLFPKSPPFSVPHQGAYPFGSFLLFFLPKVPLSAFRPGVLTLSVWSCPVLGARCWRRNETPTLQSGLNLFTLQLLLHFISFAQQSTGQVAKHHNSVTIQCAGAGRDNLYLNLFTAAKTLCWGTSLST